MVGYVDGAVAARPLVLISAAEREMNATEIESRRERRIGTHGS